MRACRYANGPQLLARVFIECPKAAIIGRADEYQAAGSHYGAADVRRAGRRQILFEQGIDYAENTAPAELAGIEVDRCQMPPRRFLARQAIHIPEPG